MTRHRQRHSMRFSPHSHGHEPHGRHFGRHGGRHGFSRDGWDRSDEGRGGRRRRVFDSNELRLVLLKLIADQPRHGYDLIRAIEELTGGAYVPSPGVVYPALSILQDLGHIEATAAENTPKAVALTPSATAQLTPKAAT